VDEKVKGVRIWKKLEQQSPKKVNQVVTVSVITGSTILTAQNRTIPREAGWRR
jgi:hypothetical protein